MEAKLSVWAVFFTQEQCLKNAWVFQKKSGLNTRCVSILSSSPYFPFIYGNFIVLY